MPERINLELFEVAPETRLYTSIAESFITSLMWRRPAAVTQATKDYVNEVVFKEQGLFEQFLEISISCAMKAGYYFNADRLHRYLMQYSLPKRDEIWTTWLSPKYEDLYKSNAVQRLIDWAWSDERKGHLNDETALLAYTALSWLLTRSNRYLRDGATKGLVCLLQYKTHLIIPLLEKFKDVNDLYVIERIYCAAYGAVLRADEVASLKELSEYIYASVFAEDIVYPHVLLRDYARGIIEFTLYKSIPLSFTPERICPPYKSIPLPNKFPTNTQTDKKYKPKRNKGNYDHEEWGSTAILSSMAREYGKRRGGYGDFGRYTFERAFHYWKIDTNGLSNYAVQRIFELGYDPLIFTKFDSSQGSGRNAGHKERIGKKYQWIVFYELLARVSDQPELFKSSGRHSRVNDEFFSGPWKPYVRGIDPTIIIKETGIEEDDFQKQWFENREYNNWTQDNLAWVRNKKDLPDPAGLIDLKDEDGNEWLWLETHPDWAEPDPFFRQYNQPHKRFWYQIRSYLIKEEEFGAIEDAYNTIFHRGSLPEARHLYEIFSREYYWSAGFDNLTGRITNPEEWIPINNREVGDFLGHVHRTTEYFNWEEEFDCSKKSAIRFYKPEMFLQQGLQLSFSSAEGELKDDSGKRICFDPSVQFDTTSGLLIRKEELLSFLAERKLNIMWTVIGEKQILEM